MPNKFLLQLTCSNHNTRHYCLQVWRERNIPTVHTDPGIRRRAALHRITCGSRSTHRAIWANQDFQPISLNNGHVLVTLFNKPMLALHCHPEKLFKELHALELFPCYEGSLALVGLHKRQESKQTCHALVSELSTHPDETGISYIWSNSFRCVLGYEYLSSFQSLNTHP